MEGVFECTGFELVLKRNGNHDHLVVLVWFVSGHSRLHTLFSLFYFPTFSTVSTACVTRWWVERDNTILTEPTSSHANCLKTRRVLPVGCTLCWAAWIGIFIDLAQLNFFHDVTAAVDFLRRNEIRNAINNIIANDTPAQINNSLVVVTNANNKANGRGTKRNGPKGGSKKRGGSKRTPGERRRLVLILKRILLGKYRNAS